MLLAGSLWLATPYLPTGGFGCDELVLYGIRELAKQHLSTNESRASTFLDNESGEYCTGMICFCSPGGHGSPAVDRGGDKAGGGDPVQEAGGTDPPLNNSQLRASQPVGGDSTEMSRTIAELIGKPYTFGHPVSHGPDLPSCMRLIITCLSTFIFYLFFRRRL